MRSVLLPFALAAVSVACTAETTVKRTNITACEEPARTIYHDPEMWVSISVPIPAAKYAMVSHEGRDIYLQVPGQNNPTLELSEPNTFGFQVGLLKGTEWTNGNPDAVMVFDESGEYLFYFADNLETELDNAAGCRLRLTLSDARQ
ncbi:MAG: hypothetical protein KDI60_00920 [Xanthomonadales bacterium]|nr:hypothetical protein [Xanthomonadales bacterium]MCP5476463.1 hypothetical protein [Rhodanobacteraceae bacterium]